MTWRGAKVERELAVRLREARVIANALHCVRDAAIVDRITSATVRVIEERMTLDGLDAVLLEALPLLGATEKKGALKKALDGVIARTGAPRDGGSARGKSRAARTSRAAPVRAGNATPSLFAEEPAPAAVAPRIAPPEGELVFVDTETTGLKAGAHQVIEIGAMTGDGAEFVALIKLERGAEVSPDAMRVNGIDLRGREWRESAVSLRDALDAFVRWLPTGAVLIAHNAAFDRRMLEADALRAGVTWPDVEWFCTKTWADELRKRGELATIDSKLHTLCSHFGVPNDGEHRALADVVRMARVFDELRAIGAEREAA